jgi:hypothetical protein
MTAVTLRPGERIIHRVRKHPVLVAVPLAVSGLLVVLDFFLMFPLFALGAGGVAGFLILILFALAAGARSFLLWHGTVFLITNQRVVDIDRQGMFRWVVSDVTYDNMADISYETAGPLQALFRAGNVQVMTVSGSQTIEAHFVPRPGQVRELIVVETGRGASKEGSADGEDGAAEATLAPEDRRAVRRYADHLQKRRGLKEYFEGESEK